MKTPKDLGSEEDPFSKLNDLIRECEIDENMKLPEFEEMVESSSKCNN